MPETATIRPLIAQDLPQVLGWRNDPAIRNVMFTSREIGFDEHQAWFERVYQDPTRRLLIVETQDGPLGFVQFSAVEDEGVSDWGFYARPDAPKGSGRLLGLTSLDHAFFSLHLHKVCGQAIARNQASIGLHKRLGFHEEGLLREQHRINGAFESVFCFGLLRSEWSETRLELLSRMKSHNQGAQE
jgi:UDP-4-amino-4,6-dideoxy-N-acetyl-beta-L-altrosamine N-acetyltransferase